MASELEELREKLEELREKQDRAEARHKRGQVVNYVLYGFTFVVMAFNIFLFGHVQNLREARNRDNAQSDLIVCSRANYQDVRDRLQDQLLLDLVVARGVRQGNPSRERLAVFKAASMQLDFRLKTQPPSGAILLTRWRGNPVPEPVTKQRQLDAAGSVARAEARDRGDLVAPPVNCDKLPSQRPFVR